MINEDSNRSNLNSNWFKCVRANFDGVHGEDVWTRMKTSEQIVYVQTMKQITFNFQFRINIKIKN